jgi:hydrogenase nickel incorporation protein HypA/HybF
MGLQSGLDRLANSERRRQDVRHAEFEVGFVTIMHEYSIIQALMTRVETEARKHGATSVHTIEVRIGEQSGVEIDLLETAFETFRVNSICAGATMKVTSVPALWQCPSCSRTLPSGNALLCQECRSPAQLISGDEIFLDRIEMEAARHV